jgi:hypothetical protein
VTPEQGTEQRLANGAPVDGGSWPAGTQPCPLAIANHNSRDTDLVSQFLDQALLKVEALPKLEALPSDRRVNGQETS